MKRRVKVRNLIIYIMLMVLVIAGSSMGLDEKKQVFSSSDCKSMTAITSQSLIATDDLHNFEIRESGYSNLLRGVRNNRFNFFDRYSLFFLCILAVLSGITILSSGAFVLNSKRYVRKRHYIITFMQDIDGRKRVS